MKEEYLHFIWKNKKIPFHLLKTTLKKDIQIKNIGTYNQSESGPDFFNSKIVYDNITWVGNIEFHVKSSDWYKHKHDLDQAYSNVILHIVYIHDKDVVIDRKVLPTIELRNLIDFDDYNIFLKQTYRYSDFPCKNEVLKIDSMYVESMKSKVLIERLTRKINLFESNIEPKQLLYQLIAVSFGMKVNHQPFFEISNRIPINIILKVPKENIKVLIQGVSGLMEDTDEWIFLKRKYSLRSIDKHSWKCKGLRPQSFPIIKLNQLADLLQRFDFQTSFIYMNEIELVSYLFDILDSCDKSYQFKVSIIINSFVPFIWWYGEKLLDSRMKEKAINVLELLPCEENQIISKWKKIGLKLKNSYDSQALLELYSHFCAKKNCLKCEVGNKIMNS